MIYFYENDFNGLPQLLPSIGVIGSVTLGTWIHEIGSLTLGIWIHEDTLVHFPHCVCITAIMYSGTAPVKRYMASTVLYVHPNDELSTIKITILWQILFIMDSLKINQLN